MNFVDAQTYALPDFMHYVNCIIEISTVVVMTMTYTISFKTVFATEY